MGTEQVGGWSAKKLGVTLLVAAFASCMVIAESSENVLNSVKRNAVKIFTDKTGQEVVVVCQDSAPTPPVGYTRALANANAKLAGTTLVAPAFDWTYGCSATSAGMMMGYYDRGDYPNMYTGPQGVCPLTNEVWGKSTYPGTTCGNCPFIASKNGVDGRTTRGHVDDYWVDYQSDSDPYYQSWTEHTPKDCLGDFMGTNQYYNWGNGDGSTMFSWYTNGTPYVPEEESSYRDGTLGMKYFVESRGYLAQSNGYFNQLIYSSTVPNGFTYAQYQQEIDAGRPVLIQVSGHTMLGVGYDTDGNKVILHDTWDYLTHEMTWGGSYSGMAHYMVSVLRPAIITVSPTSLSKEAIAGDDVPSDTLVVTAIKGSVGFTVTTSGEAWLTCSPTSGSTTTAGTNLTVSYSTASLAAGTYTSTITITPDGSGPVTVNVTLEVYEQEGANMTIGSVFSIIFSDVTISKKPQVYATNAAGKKKASVKVTNFSSNTVYCEWTAKVPVATYSLWVKVGKTSYLITTALNIVPPVLNEVYFSGDYEITATGDYFGTPKPSAYLWYTDPKTGKSRKLTLKIAKGAYSMTRVICTVNAKQFQKLIEQGVTDFGFSLKNKIAETFY